jgi:hypothetical protein
VSIDSLVPRTDRSAGPEDLESVASVVRWHPCWMVGGNHASERVGIRA